MRVCIFFALLSLKCLLVLDIRNTTSYALAVLRRRARWWPTYCAL
jgi:hypothetical protein